MVHVQYTTGLVVLDCIEGFLGFVHSVRATRNRFGEV